MLEAITQAVTRVAARQGMPWGLNKEYDLAVRRANAAGESVLRRTISLDDDSPLTNTVNGYTGKIFDLRIEAPVEKPEKILSARDREIIGRGRIVPSQPDVSLTYGCSANDMVRAFYGFRSELHGRIQLMMPRNMAFDYDGIQLITLDGKTFDLGSMRLVYQIPIPSGIPDRTSEDDGCTIISEYSFGPQGEKTRLLQQLVDQFYRGKGGHPLDPPPDIPALFSPLKG